MSRKGFTLIELLVVIAIIGALAALIFPVFAKVRAKARQTVCASNFRQVSMAMQIYTQEDDGLLPIAKTGERNDTTGTNSFFWPQLIFPYTKDWQVFRCPEDPNGNDRSYLAASNLPANTTERQLEWARSLHTDFGYNDEYLSGVSLAKIARPSTTILGVDSSVGLPYDNSKGIGYYRVGAPDGNVWTLSGPSRWYDNVALRHSDRANVAFMDGHVKSDTIAELTAGFDPNSRVITNTNAYLWGLK